MRTNKLMPSSSAPSRALLASLALHALLLAALVLVRTGGAPDVRRVVHVMSVDIVRLGRGETFGGATLDVADGPPPESAELEPVATAVTPRAAVATAAPPPEPAPESAAELDPATAPDTAPAAEPLVVEVLEAPRQPSTEPVVTEQAAALRPAPAAAVQAGPDTAEPPVAAEPEAVAVAPAVQRMLDHKLAALVADLEAGADAALSAEWQHRGQVYTATLTPVPADGSMGIDGVVAAVSTVLDGTRYSTEMRMQRLSFSSFAQFVDRWDPNVQIHDDEIDGRFHSNSEIFVSSTGRVRPKFRGKVTTAEGIDTTNAMFSSRNQDVFSGGVETHVPKIFLPRRFVPYPGEGSVGDGAHELAADAHVRFLDDGSYEWRYADSAAPPERVALGDEPHYISGAAKSAIYVSGTVNGKVLVYSPDRIVIEGSLLYAEDPAAVPDSDDYLGLVADNSVEVADAELTGSGDLTVHAAIFAKRRFAVRGFRTRSRATLTVFGSVAAGSISATEPRYRTALHFDPRLESVRPPSFPMTERFELTAWDGEWIAEPDDSWTEPAGEGRTAEVTE